MDKETGLAYFVFSLITGFLLLFVPVVAHAKSFRIDRIDIQAEILNDGNVRIEETRTYAFNGNFSWAEYKLPLHDLGTIENFELREGDAIYRQSSDESPGTYRFDVDDDEMHVKWFYRASNEKRSFTLLYTVTDVIKVYNDSAEFNYRFIGEANAERIGAVTVTIRLPQPAQENEVHAWPHGPYWGTILFEDGMLKMNVSPLNPPTLWESHITFPTSWVPHAKKRIDRDALAAILAEEARLAEQANAEREGAQQSLFRQAENERLAWHVAWILAAVSIAGSAFFFFKYGRRVNVSYNQEFDPTLPEYPPAIFSCLYFNKTVTGNALVATLFDLARRGFITIEQKEPVERKWWRIDRTLFLITPDRDKWMSSLEELKPYEQSFLDFVFNDLGEGRESVDFLDFRKHPSKVRKWFREWRKILNEEIKAIPFYDMESVKGTIYSVILSVLVIIGGIATLLKLGRPGVVAIISGFVCVIFSLFILRNTPEMKLHKLKWKAHRNYLKRYDFTSEMDQSFLSKVPDFLIFAVAMGLGSKAIQGLMERVPADQRAVFFPWYFYAHSPGSIASVADFAGAVSSMVNVASSTMSSSTGAGGGASAGTSGGAGGASGGAG